jgi:hypothetical protein
VGLCHGGSHPIFQHFKLREFQLVQLNIGSLTFCLATFF